MIHTKLLIRRLAYVPWLLAFGLVLGWAGEAQAADYPNVGQGRPYARRAGAVQIKVTAKTDRCFKLTAVTNVLLDWGEGATELPAYGAGDKDSIRTHKRGSWR